MEVQWEMRPVNGQVPIEANLDFFICSAYERNGGSPKGTMMYDEEIDFRLDCFFKWKKPCVYCRSNFRYRTIVLYLQPIEGSIEIGDFECLVLLSQKPTRSIVLVILLKNGVQSR